MTIEQVEAIEARAEAVHGRTPWLYSEQYDFRYVLSQDNEILLSGKPGPQEDILRFAAAARTDVPNLCAALKTAMKDRDEAVGALELVATYDQDDRPLPDGEGDFAWNQPFDWRRRSMKQEEIARALLARIRKDQADGK
jgi:hypothetical protein